MKKLLNRWLNALYILLTCVSFKKQIHLAKWALAYNMTQTLPVWERKIKIGKLEFWKRLDFLGKMHLPPNRRIIFRKGWMLNAC